VVSCTPEETTGPSSLQFNGIGGWMGPKAGLDTLEKK